MEPGIDHLMPHVSELVVLVDEGDNILGTIPKDQVHGLHTPLHRGFSCYLFNATGKVLIQRRSAYKKTWPLVWSNSCCGHPAPNEHVAAAVQRRLRRELGIADAQLRRGVSYRYMCSRDGIMENEICPVFIGYSESTPTPNPEEVDSIRWIAWPAFLSAIEHDVDDYSPWCKEQAGLIDPHLTEIARSFQPSLTIAPRSPLGVIAGQCQGSP